MTLEEVAEIITLDGPKAHALIPTGVRTFQEAIFVASFRKKLDDCLIVLAFYEDQFDAGVIPTPSQAAAMSKIMTFLKTNGYLTKEDHS